MLNEHIAYIALYEPIGRWNELHRTEQVLNKPACRERGRQAYHAYLSRQPRCVTHLMSCPGIRHFPAIGIFVLGQCSTQAPSTLKSEVLPTLGEGRRFRPKTIRSGRGVLSLAAVTDPFFGVNLTM